MPAKLRWAFLILFTLGLSGVLMRASLAQDDPIVERMRKDITFLASDECEGRGVGTKGLDMAADYVAAQFSKSGLKPGGINGTYFQPFPFATNAGLEGSSTLELLGPQDKKIVLKQGVDFQVLGFSAPGKFTTPLVFAGYGVTARDSAYDDYAGVDAAGKIVAVLRRLPRWTDKDRPFDGPNKDELAALENKQYRAQAARAAAVILVNDASEMPKDDLLPFQQTAKGISTISVPFVQIKRSVLDEVLKASTGKTLAETEKAIDEDLKPRSAVLQGWTANLEVKIKRQEVPVKNVIGVLEGSGPLANETIVVGAHYDHLGFGGAGSRAKDNKKDIHHGADDNASGTTAVMELSRRFGALKNREGRRVVFMTFTAEERGLIGSRHYTRVAPLFPLKNTVAMFNLDMVGRQKEDPKSKKSKLIVEGIGTAKEFDGLVTKLKPGFELVKKQTGYGPSDHDSFYSQKNPGAVLLDRHPRGLPSSHRHIGPHQRPGHEEHNRLCRARHHRTVDGSQTAGICPHRASVRRGGRRFSEAWQRSRLRVRRQGSAHRQRVEGRPGGKSRPQKRRRHRRNRRQGGPRCQRLHGGPEATAVGARSRDQDPARQQGTAAESDAEVSHLPLAA